MARHTRAGGRVLSKIHSALIAFIVVSGCDSLPTYPQTRLVESLHTMLSDGGIDASVRLLEHTVAVQAAYPDALAQAEHQVGLGPAFDDAMRKILAVVHRVLLSTDADIRFYVLLLHDPHTPGVSLTIVRYVDDVKRANANMLDTQELFARTVFKLDLVGDEPLILEHYVPRDVRLEEFLSWQMAKRIQQTLTEELHGKGAATIGRCSGAYQDGGFVFTLDVAPLLGKSLDETTLRQAFQSSIAVIARVLSGYHFESFEAIRLIHPLSGQHRVMSKTQLSAFR